MKKVLYARLHTEAYTPMVGAIGLVLPPVAKTFADLEMTSDGLNLTVRFGFKGFPVELLIPHGNISMMVVEPTESKKSSK
jgi:hypothetical protein